ncbi:hypothetical protein GCM10015535_31460 [Streptomyces gelaticus]|uniref:Uncharacterized protein n=1 Tax=Streptomyces gelaticus TaxID=285446 RepID=A0ABQ2VYH9_9ACTN|nr:hypothetical protein GCM10015535_31460 [Streptomyces gelaticus]
MEILAAARRQRQEGECGEHAYGQALFHADQLFHRRPVPFVGFEGVGAADAAAQNASCGRAETTQRRPAGGRPRTAAVAITQFVVC